MTFRFLFINVAWIVKMEILLYIYMSLVSSTCVSFDLLPSDLIIDKIYLLFWHQNSTWMPSIEQWICSKIDFTSLHQQSRLWVAHLKKIRSVWLLLIILFLYYSLNPLDFNLWWKFTFRIFFVLSNVTSIFLYTLSSVLCPTFMT